MGTNYEVSPLVSRYFVSHNAITVARLWLREAQGIVFMIRRINSADLKLPVINSNRYDYLKVGAILTTVVCAPDHRGLAFGEGWQSPAQYGSP